MEILLSLIVFILLLFLYPIYIKWSKKRQLGQFIRKEGPDLHNYKEGTPTAGGLLFVIAISFLNFSFYYLNHEPIYLIIGLTGLLFGFIGFLDDFLSIFKKHSTGLNSKQKLILQLIFSGIIIFFIKKYSPNSEILIPFSNTKLDLGFLYIPWGIIFISGMSNATNLTDGLDGLNAFIFISSMIMTVFLNGVENINHIYAIVVPVIAFLFFNIKPAKIFMGDTGSLALGGILAAYLIYYSMDLFVIFTGVIFIIELFSVIIQVSSFKLRNKRVFLMSPIHHHFELKKWSEEKIVMTFLLINITFSLIAFGGI
ncbi:MAG: phospho-N-acetylmuramoyl-pentapeptide-transferase [Thermotogota bacterium]